MLKPFFSYYGAKHRASAYLPSPEHGHIVEAFAGSAAYACRYPDHAVTLVEINPRIASVWRYLISAPAAEVLALPDIEPGGDVRTTGLAPEARALIGLWLNKGASAPRNKPSAWMRQGLRPGSFWGAAVRERIASQLQAIRHWCVVEGSYAELEFSGPATWIVDPPYQGAAGRHHPHDSVDYAHLAAWCRSRQGTTIVHENEGANWLPFEPWLRTKANESRHGGKVSHEALCILRR